MLCYQKYRSGFLKSQKADCRGVFPEEANTEFNLIDEKYLTREKGNADRTAIVKSQKRNQDYQKQLKLVDLKNRRCS